MSFDVRRAGGQEARRAAEMVLAILGERVDHGEGAVRWRRCQRQPYAVRGYFGGPHVLYTLDENLLRF